MTTLITGVSGQLAHIVATRLKESDELVGIDTRPMRRDRAFPGEFIHLKRFDHRTTAEVFRTHRPEVLVHIANVPATAKRSMTQRFTQNVLGTRHLLAMCERYGVKRVVVLSTYHVYGAYQANHVNIREDEPLRASQIFPQLADSVELDHAATTFLWRRREIETVVLRFCNIVGPTLRNMISRRLRAKRCPRMLGYDPMMQFIHQSDAANAFVLAATKPGFGVYNVAGEGAVAWSHAIRLAGSKTVPIPHFIAYPTAALMARYHLMFPEHLFDYFRYPTVIDDSAFRRDYGYAPEHSTLATLQSIGSQG